MIKAQQSATFSQQFVLMLDQKIMTAAQIAARAMLVDKQWSCW